MQRRDLLRSFASTAAGLTILKSGTLHGATAPSNKLNIALFGAWGRGTAHYRTLRNENVVALCDVNDLRTKEALRLFPGAKTYYDWRRCLEQKDIEAVVICTADHHHAFIANWALNRDLHVFCEKPLGISVDEARAVRANYLKRKARVATQHGTQRHAFPNFERVRELILDGAIGELKVVHSWDSRQLPRPGYPEGQGIAPAVLHYEQWNGPSPYHPYSPQYFGGSNGLNCLFWNMYRDFGVGQMGDMGAHTMDLVWNAIDAGAPIAIEVDQDVSDTYNPDICPVKLKVHFTHPANQWRGPVELVWYQGGLKPETPKSYIDVGKIGNGAIFEGSKGAILCDFTTRIIIPNNDDGDLTYYRRRSHQQLLPLVNGTGFPTIQFFENGLPAALGLPNTDVDAILEAEKSGRPLNPDPFQLEWVAACKGKNNAVTHGTSTKTHCDFDYSGSMMEQMLLGLVAHRAGKKLEYDPATGRITNAPEANDYLKRQYRKNWTLDG